jgi:hypothetical protein
VSDMNDPRELDGELDRLGWFLRNRNRIIARSYRAGHSVENITTATGLSPRTVFRIIQEQARKAR